MHTLYTDTHTGMHACMRAHIHTHHNMTIKFGGESIMADWYVVMSAIHQYPFHNHIVAVRVCMCVYVCGPIVGIEFRTDSCATFLKRFGHQRRERAVAYAEIHGQG